MTLTRFSAPIAVALVLDLQKCASTAAAGSCPMQVYLGATPGSEHALFQHTVRQGEGRGRAGWDRWRNTRFRIRAILKQHQAQNWKGRVGSTAENLSLLLPSISTNVVRPACGTALPVPPGCFRVRRSSSHSCEAWWLSGGGERVASERVLMVGGLGGLGNRIQGLERTKRAQCSLLQ